MEPATGRLPVAEPLPDAVKEWLAGWADHPGTAWVLRVYRNQRPPSAAV